MVLQTDRNRLLLSYLHLGLDRETAIECVNAELNAIKTFHDRFKKGKVKVARGRKAKPKKITFAQNGYAVTGFEN